MHWEGKTKGLTLSEFWVQNKRSQREERRVAGRGKKSKRVMLFVNSLILRKAKDANRMNCTCSQAAVSSSTEGGDVEMPRDCFLLKQTSVS